MASARKLISVDFEVFGRVQGVFFRKYTHDTAKKYGLVGWVKNTPHGTVVGNIQGQEEQVKKMKQWLAKAGSPLSRIDGHEFKNEESISKMSYDEFKIIRKKTVKT